jgi:hypothetical protein
MEFYDQRNLWHEANSKRRAPDTAVDDPEGCCACTNELSPNFGDGLKDQAAAWA